MLTSYTLRSATEDDLAQILAIEREVYPLPWSESGFRAEFDKPYSQFLVMTDDETDSVVAGYIVCWCILGDCQILNVAVGLPYRGLGLAKQMLGKVIALAARNGTQKVFLEVRTSNAAAIKLYQSLNFLITRTQKGFYSNGEDAYIMTINKLDEP